MKDGGREKRNFLAQKGLEVVSTSIPQILVSKYRFPQKGTRVPCRNGWFQGMYTMNLEHPVLSDLLKKWQNGSKGHRSQLEGASPGKPMTIWSSKGLTIIVYNLLNKIRILELEKNK